MAHEVLEEVLLRHLRLHRLLQAQGLLTTKATAPLRLRLASQQSHLSQLTCERLTHRTSLSVSALPVRA